MQYFIFNRRSSPPSKPLTAAPGLCTTERKRRSRHCYPGAPALSLELELPGPCWKYGLFSCSLQPFPGAQGRHLQRGALGCPAFSIPPPETPGASSSLCSATFTQQCEPTDALSLCTEQLSLLSESPGGHSGSSRAKPAVCRILLTVVRALPNRRPQRRRGGARGGRCWGSLALQTARLVLPGGKFSAITKPELARLRLPPLPLVQVSTLWGQRDAQLLCDNQLTSLRRAGAKLSSGSRQGGPALAATSSLTTSPLLSAPLLLAARTGRAAGSKRGSPKCFLQ